MIAFLCFGNAASGAPMTVPQVDLPSADYGYAGFESAVRVFTDQAYVGLAAEWVADIPPGDPFDITTTFMPELITRAGKDTEDISSGKSAFQTPEPPTIVMLLIGAGLILVFRGIRPVHRSGRRKVRAEMRKMARI